MNSVRYPDGHVLLRNLNRDYPVISHGEGPYLFDKSGKKYFDGSGGALVVSAGHGNQEIAQKIFDQISKVAYVNGTQFTSDAVENFASQLTALSPDPDLSRACFLGSGSEATEAAVKFVRQLWMERKEPKRAKIIARAPSYHGNTLYALSASAREHYKAYYGPFLHDVVTIAAPYEYRSAVEDYARDGGKHYANLFEQALLREGPETVAAFIFEPIIGSSAGASLPPPDYFTRIQSIARKHGILLIADEIMCGAGRSGKFFASEHFELKPDIILLGKGISSGYVPVSAVMVRDSHLREMKAGTGYFMHAQTYLQSPMMAAAGLATLEYYEKNDLVKNSAEMGETLHKLLHEALDAHPNVGFITGRGLFAGVELVEDRTLKTPFNRAKKVAEGFTAHAFSRGLIVWPNTGQADGVSGDLFMIGPPLNLTKAQVKELVELVAESVRSYFAS
ncbi:MAG: aspartate aminotransferase family protein [Cryobacterium sp.]|nr:aspartate aminotransferase family protein [Oligoflexia bacterium]